MAINYEQVGWDTTKHFNPTNMNHMDGGIKAACDKVDKHDSEIAEINSNLTPVKNELAGGYTTTEIDVYKCGKEQNISATITFPIDVASAHSYFVISYAPIEPASENGAMFTGTISYENKVIPAIYRINANKNIEIFLSDEIISLGAVEVSAYINVRYRIT